MPRATNKVAARARRKKILNRAKGYWGSRSKLLTVAKNTVDKALGYAYRDRRARKRQFRKLWIARINAAARINGMSYSRLVGGLRKHGIELNRKVLADLAIHDPAAFQAIADTAKS